MTGGVAGLVIESLVLMSCATLFLYMCMSYEEDDTWMSYEEEDTCMSCATLFLYMCMSYEEEDTWMSYEEEDTCMSCATLFLLKSRLRSGFAVISP
jgi:hypothetical protein